ncbi:uncharacterized protein LODBEIA_P23420 [Lodderomyces beijingensis]|uniref:Thioredoxin domain-containing protein n=1 Tax=Lodderomyces beijingensis TaxID=1775926 RepID=A0ABP0ZKF1_9ASCO
MHIFIFLHLLLLQILPIQSYTTSKVIHATDATFPTIIREPGKFTFVDFYADWCRHCKKLHPIVDELAELFADHPEIQVVKINGDVEGKKMSRKYVEIGYPTLLLFDNDAGTKVEFNGARDLMGFANFIQQLSGVRLSQGAGATGANTNTDADAVDAVGGGVEGSGEDAAVVELTPGTFDDVVKAAPYAVVSIGATWCPHCEEFKSSLDELAAVTFARDSSRVVFARYVADLHQDGNRYILDKFQIKAYPALFFFKQGDVANPTEFTGNKKKYDQVVNAINMYCGLQRDASGDLKDGAGVIPEVSQLFVPGMDARQVLMSLENLEGEEMRFYKSILESLVTGGGGKYVEIESHRIRHVLDHDLDKLQGVHIDSLKKRRNILQSLNFYLKKHSKLDI